MNRLFHICILLLFVCSGCAWFEAKEEKIYEERKEKIKEILKKYKEISWKEGGVNVEALS